MLLRYLRQSPGRWFFHAELILALGRSKGEMDRALGYLVKEGLVESRLTELPARKRVLRYKIYKQYKLLINHINFHIFAIDRYIGSN